jgi:hypothetical protein
MAAWVPGAPVPVEGVVKPSVVLVQVPALLLNDPAPVLTEPVVTVVGETRYETAVEFAVVVGFRLITAS